MHANTAHGILSLMTMNRRFKAVFVSFGLVVGLTCAAAAGQFEDGMDALNRRDYPTAMRLLRPLADQGDPRARWALGETQLPNVSRTDSQSPVSIQPIVGLIVLTTGLAIMGIAYGAQRRSHRTRRARRDAAIAEYMKSLTPEDRAEIERSRQIARERPWAPIAFGLESIERTNNGFRFRAVGVNRGLPFGFVMTFNTVNGPVALCQWAGDGAASEALLDILAYYADVPRANSRFDELVRTSAIILGAMPLNVPFAQVAQLNCKVFFELAEGQPEIYLNLDFASKTGCIMEKDAVYRKSLVHAFRA
jgi:hypothetical protein